MRARLPTLVLATLAFAFQAHAFDLQAHRGGRALLPENTLPAFKSALQMGVSTLELDIAISRDGVLLVSHDPVLNPEITRGADGRFLEGKGPAIVDLTAAQVAAYDVGRIKPGSPYARQFPLQQPVDGTRIPTFAQLVELVRQQGSQVRFAIETKVNPLRPGETIAADEFARKVIAAIREHGLEQRASVLSFDWRTLQVVQREAPGIPTVYLTLQSGNFDNLQPGSPWTAGFDVRDHGGSVPRMIKAAGGHTWSSHHSGLSAALVKEAQSLGLKVLAWTVNTPELMNRMMDLGVDGIVTDRPDLLRAEMGRRGLPLP